MTIRPFSANSYKRDKSIYVELKRPLSADLLYCNEKFVTDMNSNEYCETTTNKETVTKIPELPSSKILKSLLSEPLNHNWNSKNNYLQPIDDLIVYDTSKYTEEQIEEQGEEKEQKPTSNFGVLVPGIKTKPPLPDKVKKKENVLHVTIYPKEENVTEENLKINEENINNCFIVDLEEDIDKTDNVSTEIQELEKVSQENAGNTAFCHWIQENKNLMLETKLLETQTDIDLQNVHKHQEDLHENLLNIESILNEKQLPVEEPVEENNPSTVKNPETPKQKEIINKSVKSIKPKPNTFRQNKQEIKKEPIKKPKSILKLVPVSKKSSNTAKKSETIKQSSQDFKEEKTGDDDVNSWMSSTKHDNFLEFLSTLDDFEEEEISRIPSQRSFLQDIPERDKQEDNAAIHDEIESILEVLEKEDLKSQKTIESYKEIINNELMETNNTKHNNRNNESRNSDSYSSTSFDLPVNPNYNELFSYLEEVDKNCVRTIQTAKDRVRTVNKVTNIVVNGDNIPKLEDLLNFTPVDLAHNIVDLSLRLKEKSSGITTLQNELKKLRNLIITKTEEHEKLLKLKLKTLKDEYEPVIKRHQKFIDQLIADKKGLNQQCESLINEMKVLEDRYYSNMKATEQRHKIELQKAKEMHMAAEKLRREKWIEGKTQKIREMTVKGLEPELQNLTVRHQQELSDLRSLHKRELEDLELKAARKTQEQCEALRQQLTIERENAIAHEREILRQRLEKLVEAEEKTYQEQRRRLNAEHALRLAECEDRIANITNEKDRAVEAARKEFEDKLQLSQRRHKTELKNTKEGIELEFEVWKNNFRKQMNIKMVETEAQLRDMCKKERDKEIELVIERLEKESNEMKAQMEHATENRLRRLKEKYEEELKDLEEIVNEYKTKYGETKEKLLSAEDNILNLTTYMKQLQSQHQQTKDINDELSMDKNKIREQLKDEFISQIKNLEEQIQILKNSKEEELQKIFNRVKLTVNHKDELLTQLSQNNTNLQEKCTLLENLLEQQRKDFLIK